MSTFPDIERGHCRQVLQNYYTNSLFLACHRFAVKEFGQRKLPWQYPRERHPNKKPVPEDRIMPLVSRILYAVKIAAITPCPIEPVPHADGIKMAL
jgi:hypothetical protein